MNTKTQPETFFKVLEFNYVRIFQSENAILSIRLFRK